MISPDDLHLEEVDTDRAVALIRSVVARAAVVAPCIQDDDFAYLDAAKGIIVDVIVRRYLAYSAVPSLVSVSGRSEAIAARTPETLFWPSEISELQALCAAGQSPDGSGASPRYAFPDARPWPESCG